MCSHGSRLPGAPGCSFLYVLSLLKPVSSESGHGTLSDSIKYRLELEGEISGKEFKRSLSLSPYWQPEELNYSWFFYVIYSFLGIHLWLISDLFHEATSLTLEPISIFFFFSVVLWSSHLESLEDNLNLCLYFICAEFSSFLALADQL